MEYIKSKKSFSIRIKSNLWLAFLINFLFLAFVLIFCDLKYEVSDDFIMALILSGAFGDGPNPHMIFVNVLWGYLLIPFYKIFPDVSWYFVAQITVIFLASMTATYFLLERLDRAKAVMLSIMMILFFTNDAYILVQFTKTAMFAVTSGSVLFVDAVFHEKSKKKIAVGGLLCLVGTLIRFNTIYIAGGFLLLLLIYEFVELLRKKEKKDIKIKRTGKIALCGIILVAAAMGMNLFDDYVYDSDEQYAYFKAYGEARAKIVDYVDYGYNEYSEELQKIDVSETDYYMMKKWCFADEDVFTLEKMQKTAEIIVDRQKDFWYGWNRIIENIQEREITNYPVFQICVLLTFLGIFINFDKWWTVVVANGIGWIYIVYFFVRQRTVYRVEFSVFLGIFLCSLYMLSEIKGKSVTTRQNKKVSVIITLLLCMICGIVYLPDRSYINVTGADKKAYIENTFFESWNYDVKKYRRVVNKIDVQSDLTKEMEVNMDKFYFLDFNTTIQTLYYEWKPWKNVEWGENYQYLAGVTTNFPEIRNSLEEKGLEDSLKTLVRKDVYLVDNYYVDLKVDYIREHYYPNARAELYKEVDGYQIWKIYEE